MRAQKQRIRELKKKVESIRELQEPEIKAVKQLPKKPYIPKRSNVPIVFKTARPQTNATVYLFYTTNRGYKVDYHSRGQHVWKKTMPAREAYDLLTKIEKKQKGLYSRLPPEGFDPDLDKYLTNNR